MGRIVAIVNQKGGVGKTTTAVSLSSAMAIAERPTLLVDADPQANSTRSLGLGEDAERPSLYNVLSEGVEIGETVLQIEGLPHLSVIPSDRNLIGAEVELVGEMAREFRLKRALEPLRPHYSHIFLDCPPSLGLLTVNALSAADSVLIPVQCEYLALEGISQLTDTIERVRASLNPNLCIDGVLMTMYDDRTNLAKQVVDEVRGVFGDQVYRTVIPRNIRLGEAPSHGQSIFQYDVRSRGAEAYFNLAKELLDHETQSVGQGTQQPHSEGPAAGSVEAGPDSVGDRHRPDPAEPEPAA